MGGQHRGDGTTGPWQQAPGGQTYQPSAPAQPGWPQQPTAHQTAAGPGWPPQGGQPSGRGPSPWTHLKRAIDWDVATVVVTPKETARLGRSGIEARLHGLFAWRRSCMLVALPFLLVGVVLSFIEAKDRPSPTSFATGDGRGGFTSFGNLWSYLPSIGLVFAPIGVVAVLLTWTEMRRTSKLLTACWALSIVIPLFAALVPLHYVVDLGALNSSGLGGAGDLGDLGGLGGLGGDDGGSGIPADTISNSFVLVARIGLAINFATLLLPTVVSVPGGVVKGAARIKSMFPAASLPGWFLVGVAPFYSLFMVVVFVLLDQLVGNGLLVVGVALLAFSPWLYVIYRKVYTRRLSAREAHGELSRASRLGGYILISGVIVVAIFLMTAKVAGEDVLGSKPDTAMFTYLQVGRTLTEVIGRSLMTTVVFSMIFVNMVFAEWRSLATTSQEALAEHDAEMRTLQRYLERA